jgi:TolB-like protein/class 3 adenylate cyclase/Tfp pilus assembly protein PilF
LVPLPENRPTCFDPLGEIIDFGGFLTAERVERRLAAVLAADIAGYSLLMGRDEEGTLSQLKAFRKTLIDPSIAAHRGRIVKTTGDGMLVEFASAVDAARCAVEVQRGVSIQNAGVPRTARIEFRIGIHVGDIISDDNDIFGDGVNIAARLEGIAEPGGICISDDAQRQIRGKLDSPPFEDMGPQNLKNIAEPMRAWRLSVDAKSSAYLSPDHSDEMAQPLPLPDKPSIAVLPFQNMSSDPEQEYFADGTVEDIITALSRYPSLFVIARNSSFTYKGQAVDVKRVGRELGVRYVLEGSVRKVRDRVRVTGQLIDTSTGAHLWADRFEGGLDDIFDLQDDITLRVVGAIAPKLEQAEIVRAIRKPTNSLDGYDYYLRAMSNFHKGGREDISEALRLFHKAIEFDEKFSSAYGMAAWCYVRRRANGWAEGSSEFSEAAQITARAAECGKDDAVALATSGIATGYMFEDFELAASLMDRAQALNPNLAMAWHLSGWIRCFSGQQDLAVKHLERAVRLSPVDPQRPGMLAAIAVAHFAAGRFEIASSLAKTAMLEQSNNFMAALAAAGANAMAGNLDIATSAMVRVRELDPTFCFSKVKDRLPHREPELLARWNDALRRAGLPD